MPIRKYTPIRRLVPVIILAQVIFVALMLLSFPQSAAIKKIAALVSHTQNVLFHTSKLLSTIIDNETGLRGFILTGQQAFLQPLKNSKSIVYEQIDTLKQLTKDNPLQQLRVDTLLSVLNQRILFSDSTIKLREENGLEPAILLVATGRGKLYMDRIRELTDQMQKQEIALLQERKIVSEQSFVFLNRIIAMVTVTAIAITLILLRKEAINNTSLKKAEVSLKKNEELFRMLAENVKDNAIYMLDTDGRVANWNTGAEHVKQYKAAEIIGKSFEVFYTQESIENGEPGHNLQMAREYGHYETEGWRVRKDGSQFWANIVFTALKDKTGNLYGYSKITRDVTEQKKALEELELLNRQINQSNDSIYTLDRNYKIKSWNRGAQNLYGYNEAEALEKNPNDLLKTAMSEKELKKAIDTIAEQDYWTGELKRQTKSAQAIWVRSSTTTIKDNNDAITAYVAVSYDITSQKQLQEEVNHLANIVEHSSEAIISIGPDQRIVSWNKGAEQLHGYSKEEAIGSTALALGLIDLTDSEIEKDLQQIFEIGTWKTEMNFFRKDGSSFFGAITGNLIKNEKGEATFFYFIVKDISIRKQLEDQLKKTNEELEAFSYSVSHDLRAPLRAIVGFTAILEEDYSNKLDAEAKRITGVIKSNTIKMGKLIDDLLTFSRMVRQDIIKTTVDNNRLVKEIIDNTGDSYKNIEWVVSSLPCVNADLNTLRQVWINLISNAEKYTAKAIQPKIEIGSFHKDKQTVFFVKDNGVGFDEKYKNKLFGVFQRLHSADEFEGTGIGLAIVDKIISKYGGKVWAEAALNKGASFYFSLPADEN